MTVDTAVIPNARQQRRESASARCTVSVLSSDINVSRSVIAESVMIMSSI